MRENSRPYKILEEERVWRERDASLRSIGVRECVRCGEQKTIVEFVLNKKFGADLWNLSRRCHQCRNEAMYESRRNKSAENPLFLRLRCYDIDECSLLGMLYALDYKCYLCDKQLNYQTICVDHDHATEKVRGILCHRCNTLLGWYEIYLSQKDEVDCYIKNVTDENGVSPVCQEVFLHGLDDVNKKLISLSKKHGCTLNFVNYIWKRCNESCEICGCKITLGIVDKERCIKRANCDHDHKSGAVRGMVCSRCNGILSGYDWAKGLDGIVERYLKISNNDASVTRVDRTGWRSYGTPRGKFIIFEGIDGVGATTQARLSRDYIRDAMGKDYILYTHEPSGSVIGSFVTKILNKEPLLKSGNRWEPHWKTMAHLFMADRIYHVRNVIEPVLRSGRHVICDRYVCSMLGYQAVASGLDPGDVCGFLLEMCRNLPEPDLVLVFDLEADAAYQRRSFKRLPLKLYEHEGFQYKLSKFYKGLPRLWDTELRCPGKQFLHINADRSFEEILEDCLYVFKGMWLI